MTVDFYGLTGETLTTVLKPLLNLLEGTAAPRPESLVIRLLLPSLRRPGAVPRSTVRPDDRRPLDRLRSMSVRTAGFPRAGLTTIAVEPVRTHMRLGS